jgi:transmembrane sensor
MSQERFLQLLGRKMAGEATINDLDELEKLMQENEEWKRLAEQIMINELGITETDEYEADAAFAAHSVKMQLTGRLPAKTVSIRRNKNLLKWTMRIAAVLILVVAVADIYIVSRPGKNDKTAVSSVATKNGSRTKFVLPDGSQVWLNAGSNLDYNNLNSNKGLREVSLNGEAYFDVVRNAERPFIIHTKKMDIKVLGTSFNVRSYSDEKVTEAALLTGSIEVTLKDRKDQKIVLKPNEKISVANNELPDPVGSPQVVVREIKRNPTYNIIGEIAWTQNKLYFEDKTLEDIGRQLEKWFGKKVTITNESIRSVHYSGNFESETIEEVLSYLKLSRPFNFRIGTDKVVIY